MSLSGVPPEISALQATQAQREAAKARDRSRFASERGRRNEEASTKFRVSELEDSAEIRGLDEEDSNADERGRRRRESDQEERASRLKKNDDASGEDASHIDITA
ncbi:MAG: hypothetical protein GWP75_04380 [Planctomycetia bacterium]|nr:hypothetical protein [Planctomycetia bacterium]